MNKWQRIGQAAIAAISGGIIGYVCGALFGYVAWRIFSDDPYDLGTSFAASWFSGLGWGVGLLIGWLTVLMLWKDGD